MAITQNGAGLNIIGLDTPEPWDVALNANWGRLAVINAVGGFAITAAAIDPATLLPTSLGFNVAAGMILYRGGFTSFAARAALAAPASATTMIWLDAAATVVLGAAFPTHAPYVPLGAIVADATRITSITDYRNPSAFVGYPQFIAVNAAPADADIPNGVAALWFDPTPGAARLVVKGRNSSGAIVTGSIALA